MKKKKLNLDSLKVKSFVTSLDGGLSETVKGGDVDPGTGDGGGGGGGTAGLVCGDTNDIGCDDPRTFRCTQETRGQYGCNTNDWGCQSHYPCPDTHICPVV